MDSYWKYLLNLLFNHLTHGSAVKEGEYIGDIFTLVCK